MFARAEEGSFEHIAYRCTTDQITILAYLGEGGAFSITENGKQLGYANWQKKNHYVTEDKSIEIVSVSNKGYLRYPKKQQEYRCDSLDVISYSKEMGRPVKAISYGGRFRSGPGTHYNQPYALNKVAPVYLLEDTGVFQAAEGGGLHWFKVLSEKGVGYKPASFMCALGVAIEKLSPTCSQSTIDMAKQNGSFSGLKKRFDRENHASFSVKLSSVVGQFASQYTSIDEKHCKTLNSDDHYSVQSCPGFAGIEVKVEDVDLRQSITLVIDNKDYPLNFGQTTNHHFNELGSMIEWRYPVKQPKTITSMIVRMNVSENPDKPEKVTSYLIVTKIMKNNACVVGKISPQSDGSQNNKARLMADNAANMGCLSSR